MANPLRIGLYLDAWDFGGIATFCLNLGNGLSEVGHDVVLILSRACKPKDPLARQAFQDLLARKNFRILDLKFQYIPRKYRSAYLIHRLKKLRFDAIIVNNIDKLVPAFRKLSQSTALINVAHGDLSSGTYKLFAQSQSFCRKQVAISQAIYDTFLSMSPPAYHRNIHLVFHGVPCPAGDLIAWMDDRLRVVFCGRFEYAQKRVQDLPDIWKQFLSLGGKGVLHLVGDGEGRKHLQESLKKEIGEGSVIVHGYLNSEQVSALLRQSEVILNLSNWEGLPVSVIEGVTHGCYPVLSKIRSGHPDIALATDGILFATGDNSEVAFLLNQLRLDKSRLLRLRQQSFEGGREVFSRETMTEGYQETLNSLILEPVS